MNYERSAGGILAPDNRLVVGGRFTVEHVRAGEKIDEFVVDNLVTNEGLNHILDTVFHGRAPVGTWYLGIFEGNYTPVPSVNAGGIVAASTECTTYDEGTRPEYAEAAASGQSISNAANKAAFTMNASKTIYGAFLISSGAKGSTSGVLMAAARFSAPKNVVDDDQLLLTYTFAAASA